MIRHRWRQEKDFTRSEWLTLSEFAWEVIEKADVDKARRHWFHPYINENVIQLSEDCALHRTRQSVDNLSESPLVTFYSEEEKAGAISAILDFAHAVHPDAMEIVENGEPDYSQVGFDLARYALGVVKERKYQQIRDVEANLNTLMGKNMALVPGS